MDFTAKQIADMTDGRLEGNPDAIVNSFCKIEEGKEGAISFLSNPKYTHFLYETKASVVIVNEDLALEQPVSATLIRVPNAYETVAKLLQLYESMKAKKTGIDPLAFISPTAKIGKDCYIGAFAYVGDGVVMGDGCQVYPNVFLGDGVQMGSNCLVYPNVVIYHGCKIGNNVTLHAGCVIGADGFGFAPGPNGYDKIPQIGIVTIEDNVEIGANTTIDRSTMESTKIHDGVKLDNLIQIAHNVEVGENTAMAAQTGIAGSAHVGKNCVIAGQVGISGHLSIADRTIIGPQSGLTKGTKEPGTTIMGYPAYDYTKFMKDTARMRNINRLEEKVTELEKKLNELLSK